MAGFLYFFPDLAGYHSDTVAQCGLSDLLRPGNHGARETSAGPGGKRGVVLATKPLCEPIGYQPERQTWSECADGKFWLGYENDAKPTPADLIRRSAVVGYPIELADGQEWMIPAARVNDGTAGTMLPQSISLDAQGKRLYRTLPKYDRLAAYAVQAFDGLRHATLDEGDEVAVDEDFKWLACVEALGTNYRVTQWEVGALGILTRQLYDPVLSALVDFPAYYLMRQGQQEAQKKSASTSTPDTQSICDGAPASPKTTGQPSQTSSCSQATGGD